MSFSTLTENTFLNVEKSIGFNAEDYIAQAKKRYILYKLYANNCFIKLNFLLFEA